MAGKTKPYEQFGPYVLFKKLETDALGDLWRASRIQNNALGPTVAVRRLLGGNREALAAAAYEAQQIAGSLTGPSFARDQMIEIIGGAPVIAWAYESGRSLRTIVDRARTAGPQPQPIPLDQAIAIVERIALSLATTADLRYGGDRLAHGALIPQFVWISNDGETRVGGQHFGKGLVPSLREEKVAAEIGRYFSPEYQHTGQATKASEVYSIGAVLYLLVTGHEPPDAMRASAFTQAVRAAKTMTGQPLPDDIRAILDKSFNLDPGARFASVADMKQALSALSSSGRYAATSFNLAFYLSNLLKKEMEAEAAEIERESATNVAPYLQALAEPPVDAMAPAAAAAVAAPEARKSKLPVAIAATVVLAAAGVGAWFLLGNKPAAAPAAKVASAATIPVPQKQVIVPEPIVASASPADPATATIAPTATTDPAAQAALDEAARKKAFEDAVKAKLQAELMKLQNEYTRQLQQQQARNAPVLSSAPPPATATARAEESAPSASELDQQRLRAAEQTATQAPVTQTQAPAQQAVATQTVPAVTTQAPVPVPQVPVIREGDVVDAASLDAAPRATREPRPVYPPVAARQRIEATIMATILVSENGDVQDVKILRGDPRFGFNDSAIRALRAARYTPPMKDGKRVKTWIPQMIQFKP
jgi:periplasmic protein TonB